MSRRDRSVSSSASTDALPRQAAPQHRPSPIEVHHANEVIGLNVGGKHYDTFFQTLARQRSTYIENFIRIDQRSGRVVLNSANITRDAQGRLFFDRDGDLFAHVLQWMRNGRSTVLPADVNLLRQLTREADVFHLNELKEFLLEQIELLERQRETKAELAEGVANSVKQINNSLYYNSFKK